MSCGSAADSGAGAASSRSSPSWVRAHRRHRRQRRRRHHDVLACWARRPACGCCGCSRSRSSCSRSSRRWPPAWASSPARASRTSSATGSASAGRLSRCSSCWSPTSPTRSPSSPGAAAALEIFGVSALSHGAGRRGRRSGRWSCSPATAPWSASSSRSRSSSSTYIVVGHPGAPRLGSGRAGRSSPLRWTSRRAVLLLMVALVGTTITPYMQFYLQSAVAEKGIDEEELGLEQADAIVGSVWTNVIAVFIVVATAADALRRSAAGSTTAADAAKALAAGGRRALRPRCSRWGCSGRRCSPPRSCRSAPPS